MYISKRKLFFKFYLHVSSKIYVFGIEIVFIFTLLKLFIFLRVIVLQYNIFISLKLKNIKIISLNK